MRGRAGTKILANHNRYLRLGVGILRLTTARNILISRTPAKHTYVVWGRILLVSVSGPSCHCATAAKELDSGGVARCAQHPIRICMALPYTRSQLKEINVDRLL